MNLDATLSHKATIAATACDFSVKAAWSVMDAAIDFGDHHTVEVCRRVIDANFAGEPPKPADIDILEGYFR